MRITAFSAALAIPPCLSTSVSLEAQPVSHVQAIGTQAQIQKVMAERVKASLAGDTQAISRSMTADYIQTDISGHAQDKATWLREYFVPLASLIRSGRFKWERYDHCDLTFRVHGDFAVVMGRLDAKGIGAKWVPQQHTWIADPSASFSGSLFFTHVYRREAGKWLLAALQNAVPVGPQVPNGKCD